MTDSEKLDLILNRLDKVDGQLDKLDGRLDKVEGRLDRVDERLDKVDERFDKVDNRLEMLEVWQKKTSGQVAELQVSQKLFELNTNKILARLQDGMDTIEEILKLNDLIPRQMHNIS